MRRAEARLFRTVEHPCGYFPDRLAQNQVIDPGSPVIGAIYGTALAQGFRRAGGSVYRPDCAQCRACIPTRLPVQKFVPSRSQKRCERSNADLRVTVEPARYSDETFDLFSRYLGWRHRNAGMDATDPDDFARFLYSNWSQTQFLTLRDADRLLACAVTDITSIGLSAVYTFYEPELPRRSLGVMSILSQIRWAQRLDATHLYLGFWIDGHPKMDYKTDYRPIEMLRAGQWLQA